MENKQLRKKLKVLLLLYQLVVGMVIGGGVFFKPQAVYTLTGGAPGLGMLVWVLAGYSNNKLLDLLQQKFQLQYLKQVE